MPSELVEFANRYVKAWCRQNPQSVASFFAEGGSLSVNDDAPAVGRAAITDGRICSGGNLWFLIEFATMIFSSRRRAIHDLMARSVVVREGL